MISISDGTTLTPQEFPDKMFCRKYRNQSFVAYNLKYDEGALLQRLPRDKLQELRSEGKTEHNGYKWESIPRKMLKIVKGKNGIHIFDMFGFFGGSLQYNAEKYLGESKLDVETKKFTKTYVKANWDKLCKYCVHDALLVKRLADVLLQKFAEFGVAPRKLFSTAYVSFQYFSKHTDYVTVDYIYKYYPKLLELAMQSYNGGKFEITQKGTGYMYEYDIVSAYPAEIRDLIDIRYCNYVYSKKYRPDACYGFIDCQIKIPQDCPNPSPVKQGAIWIYPVGYISRVITKTEYDYLIEHGADIKINDAAWIIPGRIEYPYKKEINKLIKHKHRYKQEKDALGYHTIKIFLNSLYGKMAQSIKVGDRWKCTTCWNPIYASIITANCRVTMSNMQAKHPEVIAVHTDSLISTKPLPYKGVEKLGSMSYECEGEGILLGCGVYQIGKKSRFRGQHIKKDLFELVDTKSPTLKLEEIRPYSWKEVVFHNWDLSKINYFDKIKKNVKIQFDKKRIWLNDYTKFADVLKRNVESLPHIGLL